jgi:exosortase K
MKILKKISMLAAFFERQNIIPYCTIVLIAFLLKLHYSTAGSDDLLWVLLPTSLMVELFTGINFLYESGSGFVSMSENLIIAPACAGVNFLIIIFCMSSFNHIHKFKEIKNKYKSILTHLVIAYVYTILTNAVRIITGIVISKSGLFTEFQYESVHKIEGVTIFFTALFLFNIVIGKITGYTITKHKTVNKKTSRAYSKIISSGICSLIWYVIILIIIPVIKSSAIVGTMTLKCHALIIFLISVGVILMALTIQYVFSLPVSLFKLTYKKHQL